LHNLPNNSNPSEIKSMFSRIAKDYDFLNHFLSVGIDKIWRKRVAKIIKNLNSKKVLDVACGTGDLAEEIFKTNAGLERVVGVDFCYEMIEIAKKKYPHLFFITGDATMLPLKKKIFDVVTIAFGIRNIPERLKALNQFFEVLEDDGVLIILEFSMPNNIFFKFYFTKVLPLIGGFFSDKEAYTYLPNSVEKFPSPEEFRKEILDTGFKNIKVLSLNFGLIKIYIAEK